MSRTTQAFALTLGQSVNLLLGFLLVPYLARALSISDYGTYGQVLLVIGFVVTMLGFGLDKILYSDLADDNIDSPTAVVSNLWIGLLFGLFGCIAVVVLQNWIAKFLQNSMLGQLIWIFALSVPFQLIFKSLTSILIYHQKSATFVKISVVTNIVRLIGIFYFVQFVYSLHGIFVVLLGIPILQCIWGFISLPSHLKKGRFSAEVFKNQIWLGVPLGLTVIISTIFQTTDGFMVSSILNVEEFAIFRNGAIYIPLLAGIYASINTIVLPDVTKLYQQGNFQEIVTLKRRSLLNTAGIIFPVVIFFVFFAYELIPLYLGEKYERSYLTFIIFNLAILFKVTSYDDLYIASKMNKLLPKKYLIAAVVNLILNYVLIKYLGIEGAAAATLLSYIILISLLLTDSVKLVDTEFSELIPWKKLLVLLVSLVGLMFIVFLLYSAFPNPWLIIPFGLLYFCITYYLILHFNIIEKRVIRCFLSKSKVFLPMKLVFDAVFPIHKYPSH